MLPNRLKLQNLGAKLAQLNNLSATPLPDKKLSAISFLRLSEGAKIHIISQLPTKKLIVTSDSLAGRSMCDKISAYPDTKCCYVPPRDEVLAVRKNVSEASVIQRVSALSAFINGEVDTLVISADCLFQRFPSRRLLEKFSVKLSVNDEIKPYALADKLAKAGYRRQEIIGDKGEFALRGDIFDVYSVSGEVFRIEFFDDLIEGIRELNPENMSKLRQVESIVVYPSSDILLDKDGYDKAREQLLTHKSYPQSLDALSVLGIGAVTSNAIWALPFFEDSTSSILQYFTESGLPYEIIFDEPKLVFDKLTILEKEFEGRLKALGKSGEITDKHHNANYSFMEIKRQVLTARKMSFSALNLSNPMFDPTLLLEIKNKNVVKYYLDPPSIVNDLKQFVLNGTKVYLATGNVEKAKVIVENLQKENLPVHYSENGSDDGMILCTPLSIQNGFVYPDMKVCVIGVQECVGKMHSSQVKSPKTQFTIPKTGDYVVHRVHGVGICEGITRMKTGEYEKEYIVLGYRDGDKLYVATDQMDNLQKFVGEENPKLNKIGGKEFEKEKDKVKKSVRKLAIDLLALYAEREKQKGFKYELDTIWQREFEDNFPYQETPDQVKAIAEIKADMEQGKIMDRLLVGDVGFGKTEVAFRAMFKTVMAGKQAVLLAPTTILARQHYENLFERVKPFGIRCALLSRLQSAAENKKTLSDLKDGSLHIVIATHKVLSKEVSFYDLGLLVLDEEQRFGVEHKEKIKNSYPTVNVLTLSATPIPRTLNMALSGVRDISLLETAPLGRLPVDTYVTPYSDTLCVDAVQREVARGGQTLILLNDISQLDVFAIRLRALLDDKVRIITAHGQMPSGELEKRIEAFYDKQFDVLIATTIIENGIDLPDANTLVVLNADKFGLSQLYQLRGRVGRRGALAHAYFTIPEQREISDIASKRLNALMENTEIGSGFQIALSDLSIRGAGSLLGAEQHGHIERVGYEMYLELLDQAVHEMKTGESHTETANLEMKVDAPAYIRDDYVQGRDKLKIYKQISLVATYEARDMLITELTDVYGVVDLPMENLINISLLKNLAKNYGVEKIVINKNGAAAYFNNADVFKNESLMRAVSEFSESIVLTTAIPPTLIFEVNKLTPEQKIKKMTVFFDAVGK